MLVIVFFRYDKVKAIEPGTQLIQEYMFDALTCNDVRTTASYSGKKFCQEELIKKEYGLGDRTPNGEMTVIQFNPIRKFKGIKCEKRVSAITAVCGAFSHSKLVAPPDVLMPVIVTQKECALAAQPKVCFGILKIRDSYEYL